MKKKTALRALSGTIIAFGVAVLSLGALTLAWFLGPNIGSRDDEYLDGNVGLRNYFFSGDGSEENPFEIVSPIHFYNLTRLQNLGIFPGKMYFQVGHVFDFDGTPALKCINGYDNEGNPQYADYLDMGDFSHNRNVYTIGGEGVPFAGSFDGQGIPIKNLKICGNPEDVGVFGYIAHGGSITGLILEDVEVVSLGYNSNTQDSDSVLFSENIDDIFDTSASASYLVTDTSLSLYKYDSSSHTYVENNLKKLNGASGTQLVNINDGENLLTDSTIYNAYFKPTFPNVENDRFTYSIRASSPVIKKDSTIAMAGKTDDDLVIDLAPLRDSQDFNSGSNMEADAKIYLIASCEVDGYVFSRVIQSYTVEFYSNGHVYEDESFGAGIYCDYIKQDDPTDRNTNYHHGNNIGVIAGHCDGSLKDCYVFNAKFTFNEPDYNFVASETNTALVGEIGKNVSNSIEPEMGLVINGDIGIMNFSKIYGLIRNNMTSGQSVKAGYRTTMGGTRKNYISYKNFINTETIDLYKEYLRYYDGEPTEFLCQTSTTMSSVWGNYTTPSSIPNDFNSVDFLWNKVIQDEEDTDRGLGVFKLVSSYNEGAMSGAYGQYYVENMGECQIKNGDPKTKVYFSTAEYDVQKGGGFNALRATTLPSYSDINSFGYQFARDFNYVFELDLEHMDQAAGKDYMYNTDSPFLTNYLSSKLIDKYGAPVTPGSARFGFMFRSSENEILSSLSSYMPLKKPGAKHQFDASGNYYPSNSIVFRIENPNGANVSVVGGGSDISIYGYDPSTSDGGTTELYRMKSSHAGSTDAHRYFTYDVATGATGNSAVVNGGDMKESNALYGHIFKLPQGDYAIGSSSDSEANIYFLAVQGQTEGSIGTNDIVSIGDAVSDVDFLLEAPTLADYPSGYNKALFSFGALFNNTHGEFVMDVVIINDKKYMRVTFDTSPTFVTYVLTYSRHTEHTYSINGTFYNEVNHTYQVE